MIFCVKCGYQNREDSRFCHKCGGKISPVTESGSLGKGTILDGRYEIKRKIKSGGMGSVYEAVDRRFPDKLCAVKEMLTQSTNPTEQQYMVKAFRKEAEILHDLRHPHLPVVKDYFIERGRYYLVMDYIDGKDLETVIQGYFPIGVPEDKVLGWSKQILDALDYLHSLSPPVVYRDLKPANIMIRKSDEKVMLIDFGIARRVLPDSQTTKTSIGTPVFAAEELFYGKPVPESDIYSLGATMHCLLAGEMPVVPFSFKSLKEFNPDLSEDLEDIVMKALSMVPKDRYRSAKEMKQVIEKYEENKIIKKDKDDIKLKETTEKEEEIHDIEEDIGKYEVKIQTARPPVMASPVTSIPPAQSGVKATKKIIFALLSVILVASGIFALWNFYFNNAERFIEMAKAHRSDTDRVIELCNKALSLKPDNKECHILLLEAYLDKNEKDKAGEELKEVMKMKEGTVEDYRRWGDDFYDLKDYTSSAECFEYVMNKKPDDINVMAKIARCYEKLGENEEAEKKYRELGNIYLKNDPVKAVEIFKKIQHKEGLARCYMKMEHYSEAEKLLKELFYKDKSRKDIKEMLVKCYMEEGQRAESKHIDTALDLYEKAYNLDKTNIKVKKCLASCYLKKAGAFIADKDIGKAEILFAKFDRLGVKEAKLCEQKNKCLKDIKKIKDEIEVANKLHDNNSSYIPAYTVNTEPEQKTEPPAPTPDPIF